MNFNDATLAFTKNQIPGDAVQDAVLTTGSTMTGMLFTNFERLNLFTGDIVTISNATETSYISVSIGTGKLVTCSLPNGIGDGQKKVILLSTIAVGAVVQVNCNFLPPNAVIAEVYSLVFMSTGQSALLQWDSIVGMWMIVGSGCVVATQSELPLYTT